MAMGMYGYTVTFLLNRQCLTLMDRSYIPDGTLELVEPLFLVIIGEC